MVSSGQEEISGRMKGQGSYRMRVLEITKRAPHTTLCQLKQFDSTVFSSCCKNLAIRVEAAGYYGADVVLSFLFLKK